MAVSVDRQGAASPPATAELASPLLSLWAAHTPESCGFGRYRYAVMAVRFRSAHASARRQQVAVLAVVLLCSGGLLWKYSHMFASVGYSAMGYATTAQVSAGTPHSGELLSCRASS